MSTEHKTYMSPSTAKVLLDNPIPIAYHRIHHRSPPSDPMIFGSLVDAMVTDPKALEDFAILEGKEADGRTKEGKEAKARVKEQGLIPVKAEVANQARQCALNIKTHPVFQELARPQFQVKLEGDINGTPSLGYADIVADDVILDIKVFTPTVFENPSRTIYQRKIYLQLWMYQELLKTDKRLGVLVCSSEEPFYPEVWWLDEDWIRLAKDHHRRAVEAYEEYLSYDPNHSIGGMSKTVWMEGWMK